VLAEEPSQEASSPIKARPIAALNIPFAIRPMVLRALYACPGEPPEQGGLFNWIINKSYCSPTTDVFEGEEYT
jgi:hypothetical protein